MNYYESVVIDYLRGDRTIFVNTECCIQLNEGDNPDLTGPHWYCDAVAVDFSNKCIFLCEISYSRSLGDMIKRLTGWHSSWSLVQTALYRDSKLPQWPIRPWLFVPESLIPTLLKKMQGVGSLGYTPRITPLEMVQPWRYRSWSRIGELEKPEIIPPEMRG